MSEIPSQLIDTLNDVSRQQPIPREDKEFIKKNLIFLQDFIDEEDETEIVDEIIDSLEKERFTNNDKFAPIKNKSPKKSVFIKFSNKRNFFFIGLSKIGVLNFFTSGMGVRGWR